MTKKKKDLYGVIQPPESKLTPYFPQPQTKIPENAAVPKEKPQPVPFPESFKTENRDVLKTIIGSQGEVYLERLKPSQQEGIQKPIGGLSKEQQAIENQNIRNANLGELINQIGQLTPEQQARLNAIQAKQPVSFQDVKGQILTSGVTQAGYGAAGGAIAGAIGGAGIGAIPLGIAGGAAGFLSGIVTGTFAAYKHEKTESVEIIDANAQKAKYNVRQAILTLNKGGDEELAINEFNNALAELRLAERKLKLESRDNYAWATDVRLKQNDIENYLTYTLPIMRSRLILALQKPNPNYVDEGLDAEGNPL